MHLVHNMLILLLLFIDSLVEVTETAASIPKDCKQASSRSQSSVNKGMLNVKFVYNVYECFMSSHELRVSACITCHRHLNFPT